MDSSFCFMRSVHNLNAWFKRHFHVPLHSMNFFFQTSETSIAIRKSLGAIWREVTIAQVTGPARKTLTAFRKWTTPTWREIKLMTYRPVKIKIYWLINTILYALLLITCLSIFLRKLLRPWKALNRLWLCILARSCNGDLYTIWLWLIYVPARRSKICHGVKAQKTWGEIQFPYFITVPSLARLVSGIKQGKNCTYWPFRVCKTKNLSYHDVGQKNFHSFSRP